MSSIGQYFSDLANAIQGMFGVLPENSKIIFLGLDNAGKTTLMQVMAEDRLKVSAPTLHPTANELVFQGNRKFKAFDMGGHQTARLLWKDYMSGVDAIVFLIDAADRTRFEEAKIELHRVFAMDGLKDVPFVIFGNKIDKPTASSEEEFREALGLQPMNSRMNTSEITDKPSSVMSSISGMFGSITSAVGLSGSSNKEIEFNRDPKTGALYNVFMCSIAKGQGFKEGFDWGIELVNVRESTESKTLECIGSSAPMSAQQQNAGYGYEQKQPQYHQQQQYQQGPGPQHQPQQQQQQQQQYGQQQPGPFGGQQQASPFGGQQQQQQYPQQQYGQQQQQYYGQQQQQYGQQQYGQSY